MHGGLDLSAAKGLHDAMEAKGEAAFKVNGRAVKWDRKGDYLANNNEYNRKHHTVLRKGHQMVSAVAVGSVVLGDKDDKERTDALNETSHVDLAELEGDDATGGYCAATSSRSHPR